jgi:hypothetical protein
MTDWTKRSKTTSEFLAVEKLAKKEKAVEVLCSYLGRSFSTRTPLTFFVRRRS